MNKHDLEERLINFAVLIVESVETAQKNSQKQEVQNQKSKIVNHCS